MSEAARCALQHSGKSLRVGPPRRRLLVGDATNVGHCGLKLHERVYAFVARSSATGTVACESNVCRPFRRDRTMTSVAKGNYARDSIERIMRVKRARRVEILHIPPCTPTAIGTLAEARGRAANLQQLSFQDRPSRGGKDLVRSAVAGTEHLIRQRNGL